MADGLKANGGPVDGTASTSSRPTPVTFSGSDFGPSSLTVRLGDLHGKKGPKRTDTSGLSDPGTSPAGERVEQVRRIITFMLGDSGIAPTEVLVAAVGVAAPVGPDGVTHHIEYYLKGMPGADLRQALAHVKPRIIRAIAEKNAVLL